MRLARAEHRLGEFETAIATNRRARELAVANGDRQTESTCLNYIGINWHFIGDFAKAIAAHEEAMPLALGEPAQGGGLSQRSGQCL